MSVALPRTVAPPWWTLIDWRLVAAVAANPDAEFKLPDAELMPADRCKTFDTKVRFHRGPAEAAAEAKASKKMLFVLHISGHFEDPGFT